MKIDIWSDVICPFCYIGKANLEDALAQSGEAAEITHHAFRLMPGEPVVPVDQMLARKYGLTPAQVKDNQAHVEATAAQSGLEFHLSGTYGGDTTDAHRLIALAAKDGLQGEMVDRLYHAYFTETLNIFDREVLKMLGAESGLKGTDIASAFASADIDAQILGDQKQAQVMGVRGVPFVVINGKYAVSGAQPVQAFVQALQKAAAEAVKAEPATREGQTCGIDGCD